MITAMRVEAMSKSLDHPDECYIDIRVTEESCTADRSEVLVFVRGISISKEDFDRLEKARAAINISRQAIDGLNYTCSPDTCGVKKARL